LKKTLLTLAGATVLSMSAQAEQFWADNSISILQGSDYEFNKDADTTTVTLEHVSGHSWGGVFMFVDRHTGEGYKETYFEVSPKVNLVKMDGVVSNINAAFTLESGAFRVADGSFSKAQDNYLFGIGADLKIPGLDFSSVTLYQAYNDNAEDQQQVTLTYGYSMGDFSIDGYADYRFGSDDAEDNLHFNPQITYNVGPMLGTSNKIKLGVEYSNWANQFGGDNDQNAISLILKTHL